MNSQTESDRLNREIERHHDKVGELQHKLEECIATEEYDFAAIRAENLALELRMLNHKLNLLADLDS